VGESPKGFLDTADTHITEEAFTEKTIPPEHIKQVRIYDESGNLTKILDRHGNEITPEGAAKKAAPQRKPASKSSKFNLLTNKLAGISPGQKLNVQAKGIIREYGAKRVRAVEQAYDALKEDETRLGKKPE